MIVEFMNNRKIKKLSILLFTIILLASCGLTSADEIVIKATNTNLPDGRIALFTRSRKSGVIIPMDTADVKNGSFVFRLDKAKYPQSIMVFLEHFNAKKNERRAFQFMTNQRYKGGGVSTEGFMLEEGLTLDGSLSEDRSYPIRNGVKSIVVRVNEQLKKGRQTQACYNDTLGFMPQIGTPSLTKIDKIKEVIKKHAYSYHYLYGLERRIGEFSNENLLDFFRCLDKELQESETGKRLIAYVKNRKSVKLTFSTALPNERGQPVPILNQDANYNLIVLWASWCGPCRLEIPSLKALHKKVAKQYNLSMVSVSFDTDKSAWANAVQKEQMPWQQLVINESINVYAKEIFQYGGYIPTMLLVNKKGEIVKKMVGYDEKNNLAIEKIISEGTIAN